MLFINLNEQYFYYIADIIIIFIAINIIIIFLKVFKNLIFNTKIAIIRIKLDYYI